MFPDSEGFSRRKACSDQVFITLEQLFKLNVRDSFDKSSELEDESAFSQKRTVTRLKGSGGRLEKNGNNILLHY